MFNTFQHCRRAGWETNSICTLRAKLHKITGHQKTLDKWINHRKKESAESAETHVDTIDSSAPDAYCDLTQHGRRTLNQRNINNYSEKYGRLGGTCAISASVTYCLVVLWYVATFPDIGVRCLLPNTPNEQELEIVQFANAEADCLPTILSPGDKLIRAGRFPANNFLLFSQTLAGLRGATIPPGGQLNPGSDPSEVPESRVPALVEISRSPHNETSASGRMLELVIRQPDSQAPNLTTRTYVAVKPIRSRDFLLTIMWFLCQLGILLVALTAWWQRPSDQVVRVFCLMCCTSMPAFVGGFHWWIIVASPLLNLPFIFAACLLPAVTLHFFFKFPRESPLLKKNHNLALALIYGPATGMALLVGFVYWSAYILNGQFDTPDSFSLFQKLVAVASGLTRDGGLSFHSAEVCAYLLYLLRNLVYAAIGLSSVYFALTVLTLSMSLLRTQNPVERRQASGILIASLFSTIPILYTLYLAFYRKTDFALGQAQLPMFVASGSFMAAYAHGMMKHRLILADELLKRGRQYFLISGLVTVASAVLLAAGAALTRVYGLPQESSLLLQLSLFLILVIATAFVLWARDRIQSVVDQRFFSEKYQLDKTLKQLNQASGYLADPSALAQITLVSCRDVMDASTSAMFVREASGTLRLIGADQSSNVPTSLSPEVLKNAGQSEQVIRRIPSLSRDKMLPVQQLLHDLPAELICFLRSEQGVDGLIILGKRNNGVPYSPEDIAFLQAMGQMTVLALHSSRANQNLARLNSEFKVKVDRIAEQQRQLAILRAELTSLQHADGEERQQDSTKGLDRGEIRGNSGAILDVLHLVRKAAASTATVLIRGESGTGKELLARVVHRNSDRADKPLVSVNCAALAPSLLESELFGHVRGAFTGAGSDKAGRFQAANGGTLFLDEIGDISLETQVKLLRVLQERCFEPVGTNDTVRVDVRMIAATNRDLEAMIASGEFREDLYYRLNVVSVTLPPLRDRREDLIELVFFFLNRAVQKTDKRIHHIEPDALAVIEQHRWPGNIRELENVIERAVVLADGETITLKDLPEEMRAAATPVFAESSQPVVEDWTWYADRNTGEQSKTVVDTRRTSSSHNPAKREVRRDTRSFSRQSISAEKALMVSALESANGNKAQAARALEMPRSTFYSKLKKHGLAD